MHRKAAGRSPFVTNLRRSSTGATSPRPDTDRQTAERDAPNRRRAPVLPGWLFGRAAGLALLRLALNRSVDTDNRIAGEIEELVEPQHVFARRICFPRPHRVLGLHDVRQPAGFLLREHFVEQGTDPVRIRAISVCLRVVWPAHQAQLNDGFPYVLTRKRHLLTPLPGEPVLRAERPRTRIIQPEAFRQTRDTNRNGLAPFVTNRKRS